jgi:hypothetical protein
MKITVTLYWNTRRWLFLRRHDMRALWAGDERGNLHVYQAYIAGVATLRTRTT